jgi:hypothetical protein
MAGINKLLKSDFILEMSEIHHKAIEGFKQTVEKLENYPTQNIISK